MGDTTPIPAPRRGLSGSANVTVLLKFAPDQQPLLPWQRKFENFNRKLAITQLVWEIRPPFLHLVGTCTFVADARERRLRSTASRTCVVTRTYSTFGDRAFGAAGPGLWNSLPSHLKDADLSYREFRRLLKTFLFGQWGHGAV